MRRFHSYGPVDCEEHFCVQRKELVRQCTEQLIGNPEKGGHYFTIWAPRQTGKTWLLRQVKKELGVRSDTFVFGSMSVQGVIMDADEPAENFLDKIPLLIWETFEKEIPAPADWESFKSLFSKKTEMFDRPVILFIDEFDSLPPKVIDQLVTLFRDMFLKRESYILHGLVLIGVRAVLGVESLRGSPFNIQRSLHISNFTQEEVRDLYRQYQEESGQKIEPEVVTKIFESTLGQPGLVCWFGELLTEKYNPGKENPIRLNEWKRVYHRAMNVEWNNTVLNLVKKARGEYRDHVLELFARSDIRFSLDAEWCSYLYLNGIIGTKTETDETGEETAVCFFSSPFIQQRLHNALAADVIGHRMPILTLEPLDDLSDVFDNSELNLPALMERYKAYLRRLKAKGLNPWKDQPRRADMHLTEYVGHFHLCAWLRDALEGRCVVSPEFPTGNGRVDLHLKCGEKRGIIEVKSFRSRSETEAARVQAARYAARLGLKSVTLAVFVPVEDEDVLKQLSGQTTTDRIEVTVSAIGWV